MDGTLLDHKGMLSKENKEAVQAAHHQGIMITLATGRGIASAEHHLNVIGVDGAIVALNGAYIRNKGSKKILYKYPLTLEETKIIHEIVGSYGIRTYFSTANMSITNKKLTEEMIARQNVQGGTPLFFYDNDQLKNSFKIFAGEFLKISIVNENDQESFEKAEKQLRNLGVFEVVNSDINYIEVMKQGCSKGRGVKLLAEHLGIKREEIVCIGDNENDVSMIKYAGFGIAMGNGCEMVKQEATYITDTCMNNGVAKAIHKILGV